MINFAINERCDLCKIAKNEIVNYVCTQTCVVDAALFSDVRKSVGPIAEPCVHIALGVQKQ